MVPGYSLSAKNKTYLLCMAIKIFTGGAFTPMLDITAMGIRKKYDGNFIFIFAVVNVRYGGITTAKILKQGD